jgi:hypothetical protein
MRITSLLAVWFVAVSLLLPMASAASITRSLSPTTVAPGGTVTVTLSVDVSGAADYYAVDDIFPPGFEVISSGSGSIQHQGHWKQVVIEGATNTEYTYTLKAPSEEGIYFFSSDSEYMFGGMTESVAISGQDTITVASQSFDSAWVVLVIVVVAVALIFLVLKQLKRI